MKAKGTVTKKSNWYQYRQILVGEGPWSEQNMFYHFLTFDVAKISDFSFELISENPEKYGKNTGYIEQLPNYMSKFCKLMVSKFAK